MRRLPKGRAKQVGVAFAKAVTRELFKGPMLEYRTVAANLRQIERYYVRQLPANNRHLRLEIKRRIAETLLEEALFRPCSIAKCTARMRFLSKLGFTDIESKAHYYLLYAKGAMARGHRRIAKRCVTQVIRELTRSLRERRNPLAKHLLEIAVGYQSYLERSPDSHQG